MIIRPFTAADREAVLELLAAAFGRQASPDAAPEARLFADLLDDGDLIEPLTLVAVAEGRLVGHVACSRATVGVHPVVALGPIGVVPDRQGQGIGSSLVEAVLAAADETRVPLVALLGSTAYYPRFGFAPGAGIGIDAPDAAWGNDFQVRVLGAYRPEIKGSFHYARAFASVGAR